MRYTSEQAQNRLRGLERSAAAACEALERAVDSGDSYRIAAAERRLERAEERLGFARDVAQNGEPGRVYERLVI